MAAAAWGQRKYTSLARARSLVKSSIQPCQLMSLAFRSLQIYPKAMRRRLAVVRHQPKDGLSKKRISAEPYTLDASVNQSKGNIS